MEDYLGPDDARRFSDAVIGAKIDYAETPAFVLGADLAQLVDGKEESLVRQFLTKVGDPSDPDSTASRFARVAPRSWGGEEDEVLRRMRAFQKGLG